VVGRTDYSGRVKLSSCSVSKRIGLGCWQVRRVSCRHISNPNHLLEGAQTNNHIHDTEFAQAHLREQPSYQVYQIGHQTFATTATLSAASTTFSTPPPIFGSPTISFNTKKAAKANAARDAVLWLRTNGHLNADGSASLLHGPNAGAKRKRAGAGGGSSASEAGSSSDAQDTPVVSSGAEATSFAQRVNVLRKQLGLPNLMYELTAAQGSAIYTVHASFGGIHAGSVPFALRGPIAEVRNVFGKKNAKEECAKVVMGMLEKVKRERLGELEA